MPALQLLDNIIPISDFNHGKAGAAFSKVKTEAPVVVLKHNVPSFVISTTSDYRSAKEAEENLELLMLALERTENESIDECLSTEEVMAKLGINQADIDAMDEVDFE